MHLKVELYRFMITISSFVCLIFVNMSIAVGTFPTVELVSELWIRIWLEIILHSILALSIQGHRVILTSALPDHSLADSLDTFLDYFPH